MTKSERLHLYASHAASRHGVAVDDILSRSRKSKHVAARKEVMHLYRDAGFSLKQIGLALGRDHTTVLHGLRKFDR
jgi:chromosomal replication initiation ATPase DnaA